jgi:predicted nucleic acid-binding Zn ribbon protein
MAIKERRIRCRACGERVTVIRGERGPVSAYCDACRAERKREQARARMAAMRARRGTSQG